MPNIYEVSTAAALILVMALAWRHVKDSRRWIAALSASFSFIGLISASRFILNWWALEAPRRQVMARNISTALESPLATNTARVLTSDWFFAVTLLIVIPVLLYSVIVAVKTAFRRQSIKSRRSSSKTIVKP